ncbi:hypothetical protein HMPREF3157_03160 [Dermabacter sp. HMSC06F07]|uniref:hypothetical protein n=1 Tax=Dermabacter TaxID=36739 RepID=UPI00035403CF|nr:MULTISPECIES: hypothetical protein [Dermabacter]EPH15397.1 hypothetical protein HMPREF1484_01031 [Dermabacter sp. HFH0086]MCT1807711.1 hypothetical protein [Dermabacter hominis]MDK8802592.1 hypothetical protein [Dermabacter hominis]MDU4923527.1 hypothetical protein [Dermabacter sp.]MDU5962934.1 hypothetical protein [Dermabacter sp.]
MTMHAPAPSRSPLLLPALAIGALFLAIVGGALGLLKWAIVIGIGIGLAVAGLALAAWVLARAVRDGDTAGMFVGSVAAIAAFFASTAGVLTLLARIVAHDV